MVKALDLKSNGIFPRRFEPCPEANCFLRSLYKHIPVYVFFCKMYWLFDNVRYVYVRRQIDGSSRYTRCVARSAQHVYFVMNRLCRLTNLNRPYMIDKRTCLYQRIILRMTLVSIITHGTPLFIQITYVYTTGQCCYKKHNICRFCCQSN